MATSNALSSVNWIKQPETICKYIRGSKQNFTVDIISSDLADPDIAGVGVIVSFLTTAYLVFIWMFVAYLGRWLPSDLLGRADRLLYKRYPRSDDDHSWWQEAASNVVIGYADQQIATGIAILVAGFVKMPDISVYHLHVVIYLAWMSSNTHLSAISLLQADFRNSKRSRWRALRIVGMCAIGVMVLVALLPTTSTVWGQLVNAGKGQAAGIPARCFWHRRYSGYLRGDSIWSFVILIMGLIGKGLLLFEGTRKFCLEQVKDGYLNKIGKALDSIVDCKERIYQRSSLQVKARDVALNLVFKVVMALYVAAWLFFELLESFVASLWMCMIGLAWGSTHILLHRSYISDSILDQENEWGFGQILPVALLVVPFLACMETFTGEHYREKKQNEMKILGSESVNYAPPSMILPSDTTFADDGFEMSDTEDRTQRFSPSQSSDTEDRRQHLSPNPEEEEKKKRAVHRAALQARLSKQDIPNGCLPVWQQQDYMYNYLFVRSFLWAIHLFIFIFVGRFFFLHFNLAPGYSEPVGNAILVVELVYGLTLLLLWFLVGMIFSRLFKLDAPVPQKFRLQSGLLSPLLDLYPAKVVLQAESTYGK